MTNFIQNPEPKQAEFLVKTDGGYVLQVLDENAGGEDVVRVPDGATAYVNVFEFFQWEAVFYDFGKKQPLVFCDNEWADFISNYPTLQSLVDDGDIILWQRETLNDQVASAEEFKQPEDLPFLDNGIDIGVENLPDFTPEFPSEKEIKTDFPLNRGEINYRAAIAFNAIRGTDLTEEDVHFLRELLNSITNHYGA